MNPQLYPALAEALENLKIICRETGSLSGRDRADRPRFNQVVNQAADIADLLGKAPYLPAEEVAARTGAGRDQVLLSYKLIQQTRAAAARVEASPNKDYLNIVNHYFINQMYVVVFFVGLACPGRCCFCPNVTIDENGARTLARYPAKQSDCISAGEIDQVFKDLSQLTAKGTSVVVKISGGLEPMTDPHTMKMILDRGKDRDIRIKLFTNGLLLNTEKRRRLALGAGDIRISLGTCDEKEYASLMFGPDAGRKKQFGLAVLLDNIKCLVRERNRNNPDTRIGINAIVLEENCRQMMAFIDMARGLGVDYIDFKPNYFSGYPPEVHDRIAHTIERIKARGTPPGMGIYFAGSLLPRNLFWTHRRGKCRPHKQSRFKLFITPHGYCSPVHYGAFPTIELPGQERGPVYTGGRISGRSSLLDVISRMPSLPDLAYDKLNPFEHMLALEIRREEKDRSWGIPRACDPWHGSLAHAIPRDLRENRVLRQV